MRLVRRSRSLTSPLPGCRRWATSIPTATAWTMCLWTTLPTTVGEVRVDWRGGGSITRGWGAGAAAGRENGAVRYALCGSDRGAGLL
jgi:hypothetical protein